MNPAISVIIPVYNSSTYLLNCLKSASGQTLGDIEIICVDDGSYDDSPRILEEYGKEEKRLKVIRQPNQGAGMARNNAIRASGGEYLAFLDSDDFYPNPHALEKLYTAASENKSNICGGSRITLYNGIILPKMLMPSDSISQINGYNEYRKYQYDYHFQRFIYKTSFIKDNDIKFKNYLRYQDPPFLVDAMSKAGKFYTIKEKVYCYRHKKRISWTKKKVVDLLSGIEDNIVKAIELDYQILLDNQIKRINRNFLQPILDEIEKNDEDVIIKIMHIQDIIDNHSNKNSSSEKIVLVPFEKLQAISHVR